jgi:hypothetical protein
MANPTNIPPAIVKLLNQARSIIPPERRQQPEGGIVATLIPYSYILTTRRFLTAMLSSNCLALQKVDAAAMYTYFIRGS